MSYTDYMSDIGSTLGVNSSSAVELIHSTNEDNTSLDMDDFLNLMVVTLQNQTIDNTADTSDMMNQLVQMSVVQALDDITSLIEDSTSLTYASSLLGKQVTVGVWEGSTLKEIEGTVTGSGTLNGQQVIFLDNNDQAYALNSILALGTLPDQIIAPGETVTYDNSTTDTSTTDTTDETVVDAVDETADETVEDAVDETAEDNLVDAAADVD